MPHVSILLAAVLSCLIFINAINVSNPIPNQEIWFSLPFLFSLNKNDINLLHEMKSDQIEASTYGQPSDSVLAASTASSPRM